MPSIYDLRSALKLLSQVEGEMTLIERPISPDIELVEDFLAESRQSGGIADEQPLRVYQQPTRGKFPVLMGVFGTRRRCRLFLDPSGCQPPELSEAQLLLQAASAPIGPRVLERPRLSRTVNKSNNILAALPALRYALDDPGPTVTLGLIYAHDRRTGIANCSYHRIAFKGNSAVVGIDSHGHLQTMLAAHVSRGESLPISINIGLDPAVYLASALTRPCIAYGCDELGIAGAIRGRPVDIAPCHANEGGYIDHAELVIEGTLGAEREPESAMTSGFSIPEYLGYRSQCGMAATLRIQVLTHRPNPVYQTLSGPGFEQSILLGLGQECSILARLRVGEHARLVRNVVALPSGGGHLLTVLQVAKRDVRDDRLVVEVAKMLFEEVPSLKNLLLVDEDVDPYSVNDVLWALCTRARLDLDIHVSALFPANPLDPTQSRFYDERESDSRIRKCVVDCTVPYSQRRRFKRAFDLSGTPTHLPVR
ncbi:UbiD family decarboxylase [Serratia ficaria]|uniref:3-octaprenyl-4-hydroxybenzoate carboxy-lyase n=2 Tax=Serratia ficaria TaxID=61651 RepID=A0A240BVY3_SERFI|nr:UbiD family decarboxylase [Serratia ficaria]REF45192.1 4-hydroxy-3-polyprenylbenzoate decarboxylase [Serratia ficaria]CAI0714904.1 3-octaprenyl-4-hydroxybenzoate carboxy-lyase [Serratia ficaria]CAI0825976.1 3-octaprenyl-4-hydroxybenzoate carboxy-lyase [Serratia ficaria]CAI0868272.1 3-octaprenyl-4-hydroxybenzoate carboxy-lyase [Serratia ficaria]CAI0912404.1 3-octaprenyl-4-hydroxybenzoate carboxy-lyase [Serratia ficaria]